MLQTVVDDDGAGTEASAGRLERGGRREGERIGAAREGDEHQRIRRKPDEPIANGTSCVGDGRGQPWATLTIGLRQLQQLDRSDWPMLMAGAVLLAVPAMLVFASRLEIIFGTGIAA